MSSDDWDEYGEPRPRPRRRILYLFERYLWTERTPRHEKIKHVFFLLVFPIVLAVIFGVVGLIDAFVNRGLRGPANRHPELNKHRLEPSEPNGDKGPPDNPTESVQKSKD